MEKASVTLPPNLQIIIGRLAEYKGEKDATADLIAACLDSIPHLMHDLSHAGAMTALSMLKNALLKIYDKDFTDFNNCAVQLCEDSRLIISQMPSGTYFAAQRFFESEAFYTASLPASDNFCGTAAELLAHSADNPGIATDIQHFMVHVQEALRPDQRLPEAYDFALKLLR